MEGRCRRETEGPATTVYTNIPAPLYKGLRQSETLLTKKLNSAKAIAGESQGTKLDTGEQNQRSLRIGGGVGR